MNYSISYISSIKFGRIITSHTFEYQPELFRSCKNLDELEAEIRSYFHDNIIYTGDIVVYDSECFIGIPDDFIKEWRTDRIMHLSLEENVINNLYVNVDYETVVSELKKAGIKNKVISIDGKEQVVTGDVKDDRLLICLENNLVTKIFIG